MRRVRLGSILGGYAAAVALLSVSSASAATLVGDYQMQGTRSSSGPGSPLTDLGAGVNSFQSDTVMGSSRQVLAFPVHNGLNLNPTGTTGNNYSVVSTFRLATVSGTDGYVRILDSTKGGSDGGLYAHNGKADYYDTTITPDHESPTAVFSDNVYATVAITQVYAPSALTSFYVNGVLAAQAGTAFPVINDTLRFFRDDTPDEESAGAVSCIRVFSSALTAGEVSAIGASATCGAPSRPATAQHKKCKKKHKKHSAGVAKKCKKHKKR